MLYAVNGYAQNLKTNQRINPNTDTAQLTQAESQRSATDADLKASGNTSPFDAVKGKKEDQSKRDAFSKHYINEDGSFTALIGAGPIHYEKNGQFLDIDHKITQNPNADFPFVNATNLMESYFGASSHTGIKNKTAEGEVKEFLNTKMYWEVNGQAVGTVNSANVPVSIVNDKAYYNNLYGNIAAEFAVLTGKRELNYIIHQKQDLGNIPDHADYLVFSEDVVLPYGWTHTITENGILIQNQFGKEMYLYENPVSTDAKNELRQEENTVFETALIGNTLTIKTKVKTEWLLSNERVFPVKVDPTVNVYPNVTTNWTRSVANDGYDYNDFQFGRDSGYFVRGFIKYNLTSISSSAIINSASGYVYIFDIQVNSHNTNAFRFKNALDPTTYSGSTLYNSATTFYSSDRLTNQSLGWKNSTFNSEGLSTTKNNFGGYLSLSVDPGGSWHNTSIYKMRNHIGGPNGDLKPYLLIDYTVPSTDRTLTISEAYTGANPANGSYTYANNTSVTATSGTRAGYIVTGWTGTGSVPATGTTGSVTFNITQNSTITWQWEQTETPKDVVFHNYGGTEQLAFNNSRINTDQPVFRVSHGGGYAANMYQIQISPNADFSGTPATLPFNINNPANNQVNLTFDHPTFTPTNGTTYYVRARVRGAANVWSDYTTETYSFTYQTPKPSPDWFQTTQAQFQSNALSGVEANASHDVIVSSGSGNPIQNPSFETNTNWTGFKTNASVLTVNTYDSGNWSSQGSRAARMYMFGGYALSSDIAVVSQVVNLTNIEQIIFDARSLYSPNFTSSLSNGGTLRLIIGGSSSNATGVTIATINHCASGSNSCNQQTLDFVANIPVAQRIPNQTIKFVWTGFNSGDLGGALVDFMVDNLRVTSVSSGTITSTPIHLESVQGATAYEGITWNQTLDGGNLTLKVQGSDNGTNFIDIPGYTNISETGDGVKTLDLSQIQTPPAHIRLVGTLNGQNVKMHDWAVSFKQEDCATSTTWNGSSWSNGYPTESPKKQVVFEADYTFDSDEIMYACEVMIEDEVLVSANSSLLVDEFVIVSEDGWLVIESGGTVEVDDEFLTEGIVEVGGDLIVHGAVINYEEDPEYFVIWDGGNLVQINDDAVNEGVIKVEKLFTFSAERNQYNFVNSPVIDQNIRQIYGGNPRVQFYDESSNSFIFNDATNPDYMPGIGQALREPSSAANSNNAPTAEFVGVPFNGSLTINELTNERTGFHLIGNPYPSLLDLDLLYTNNTMVLEPRFLFWDNRGNPDITQQGDGYSGNHYAQYNAVNNTGVAAGGTAASGPGNEGYAPRIPDGKLAVGSAVMVRLLYEVPEDGNSIVLNNTQRTAGQGLNFLGRNYSTDGIVSSEIDRYWLTLNTPGGISAMNAVVYFDGGNDAFGLDDNKIMGGSDDIFTLVDEHQLKIQGKSSFDIDDKIQLGYKAYAAGVHTISIYDSEGVFADGQTMYLVDQDLDIIHNLSEETYTFQTEAGEFNDRFLVVYKEDEVLSTLDFANGDIQVYRQDKTTVIHSLNQDLSELKIFNLNGQMVLHQDQLSGKYSYLPNDRLGKQVLVLNVKTADGKVHSFKVLTH